jgi:Zc3h12a-like Ribonuclease NYN domain
MYPFSRILPLAEITFLTPPPGVSDAPGQIEIFLSDPKVMLGLLVLALVLLFFVLRRQTESRLPTSRSALPPNATPNWIVIDGSNVMHWKDETPQIASVQAVVHELKARGFAPGVVFDANAGYKLFGRYQNEKDFARLLGLPDDRVFVVPKGTQADPYLLSAARDLGARIVTRDRFRDWAEAHPEVNSAGFLIRGGYRAGSLWIEEAWPKGIETVG